MSSLSWACTHEYTLLGVHSFEYTPRSVYSAKYTPRSVYSTEYTLCRPGWACNRRWVLSWVHAPGSVLRWVHAPGGVLRWVHAPGSVLRWAHAPESVLMRTRPGKCTEYTLEFVEWPENLPTRWLALFKRTNFHEISSIFFTKITLIGSGRCDNVPKCCSYQWHDSHAVINVCTACAPSRVQNVGKKLISKIHCFLNTL